jgi:hypothetical protein
MLFNIWGMKKTKKKIQRENLQRIYSEGTESYTRRADQVHNFLAHHVHDSKHVLFII